MKLILLFLILPLTELVSAQSIFPGFLHGTWKMENEEIYEHWDRLNDNILKGFSYNMVNGEITISEYLDISRNGHEIKYTATVLNQNQGKGIDFILSKSDSAYTFENLNHDFPKKIIYKKLTGTEIIVQVSDGNQKGFTYRMKKQPEKPAENDTTVSNPDYDAILAKRLGADDYGMKAYILVILKTGLNKTTDKTFINNSFMGHLENINRLAKEGKLIVAGPMGKNDRSYRGIFILNLSKIEEAESLLQTDPAVKAGLLDAELYNWYGSAALPEYLKYADKIWKSRP